MGTAQQAGALGSKLSVQQLDRLICGLAALQAPGASAERVLRLLTGGDGDLGCDADMSGELTDLISLDASMTAGLLALANRSNSVASTTAAGAVEKLSFDVVRSALLAGRVFAAPMQVDPRDEALDAEAFGRHCLAVGIASEMLAGYSTTPVDPAQAFTCGLLHDIGKLVLAQAMPRSYRRVVSATARHHGNIGHYERRIIGVDHSVAGLHLARQWKLGSAIEAAAWLSHQPTEAIPESISDRTVVEIVNLADTIAREKNIGFSGNFKFPRSSRQLSDQLSLPPEIPARIADCLGDEVDRRLKALAPVSASADPAAYQRTIHRANIELGRLNEELRLRNTQLRTDARAFRELQHFASLVAPDASVPQVLAAVAAAAGSAAGVQPSPAEPILAYCAGYDVGDVTLAIADGRSEPVFRTLAGNPSFDHAAPIGANASAAAPVAAVLADVSVLGQWIDLAIYRHHPLIFRGRWIGGVLCPAAAEEFDGPAAAFDALAEIIALPLALARGQDRAMRISEQLAGAGEVLAATQEALAEARTLAAMGEMAAGAGHELNNPLAVISGRAQLMREQASKAEDRETWQQIAEQSQRISDIITDLMDFASPRGASGAPVDAGQLLREVVDAVKASGDPSVSGCEIVIESPPAPLSIFADAAQIRVALREVVTNAAIAATGAPQVRISAEAGELNETVLVTITDNGPGMDSATLASVFTPFFSVQEAGRRRGLGLPRAQRYVINNGGRMWIESRLGEGTTVFIQLPRAAR